METIMPQPKKHSSVRARANKASTSATLTGEVVPALRPDLPDLPGREWHPQTVEWWNEMWASPMAAEYHVSDRHALYVLAILMDDFWENPGVMKAGEIRLQRQSFGLTPYDRRRLEWTIETAEGAKADGRRRRSERELPPAEGDGTDPRAGLYAV